MSKKNVTLDQVFCEIVKYIDKKFSMAETAFKFARNTPQFMGGLTNDNVAEAIDTFKKIKTFNLGDKLIKKFDLRQELIAFKGKADKANIKDYSVEHGISKLWNLPGNKFQNMIIEEGNTFTQFNVWFEDWLGKEILNILVKDDEPLDISKVELNALRIALKESMQSYMDEIGDTFNISACPATGGGTRKHYRNKSHKGKKAKSKKAKSKKAKSKKAKSKKAKRKKAKQTKRNKKAKKA